MTRVISDISDATCFLVTSDRGDNDSLLVRLELQLHDGGTTKDTHIFILSVFEVDVRFRQRQAVNTVLTCFLKRPDETTRPRL